MRMEPKILLRLQFLVRVVRKECKHLNTTDQRLFGSQFTLEQATRLEEDTDLGQSGWKPLWADLAAYKTPK